MVTCVLFNLASLDAREVTQMKKSTFKLSAGFTLIELMIVVAIIGILAAIAVPKFADLVTKSRESAVKGSLGALRSAVSIYYSDTEGVFPASAAPTNFAAALTTGAKYLRAIPVSAVPKPALHPSADGVVTAIGDWTGGTGAWYYSGSLEGVVLVNCNLHADSKGSTWSTW
jgi:prepilin-type N-terminal cleavage/methylation domain-containing protein